MKHQQVVVDYWTMVKTSCTCLFLAFAGYILLKMLQAVFWLPGYLNQNQKRLEELAAKLCSDLDKNDSVSSNGKDDELINEEDIISEKEGIVDNKNEIIDNKKDK